MEKNLRMPSPSDVAYIDAGVHAYIMDVLREKRVDYKSPQHDLIYNQVVTEIKKLICSSIQSK